MRSLRLPRGAIVSVTLCLRSIVDLRANHPKITGGGHTQRSVLGDKHQVSTCPVDKKLQIVVCHGSTATLARGRKPYAFSNSSKFFTMSRPYFANERSPMCR